MDVELDEDFANFESMSQMALASSVDEELILLDREVTRREHEYQDEKRERNNNDVSLNGCGQTSNAEESGSREGFRLDELKREGKCVSPLSAAMEDKVLTTFPFGAGKRLTMIPVKYKLKDERRKILKISVNKLKKIEDPESWLCRSVLINNTMKKLQKETRDEKNQKQSSGVSVSLPSNLVAKQGCEDLFQCKLSPGSVGEEVYSGSQDPVYQRPNGVEANSEENRCCADGDDIEVCNAAETRESVREKLQEDLLSEGVKSKGSQDSNGTGFVVSPTPQEHLDQANETLLTLAERCLLRKNSLGAEACATVANCPFQSTDNSPFRETDDVDECCDVHDVLSQLYLPPTPRMLTSIDSDTDEDELSVGDSEQSRPGCGKLPEVDFPREKDLCPKRIRQEDSELVEGCPKRRKSCQECTDGSDSFSTFERMPVCRTNGREQKEEEEDDAEKRLSRCLSSQYPKGPGEAFYEENNCDSQYSCGHAVSLFAGDLQAVGFHNLIAGLET